MRDPHEWNTVPETLVKATTNYESDRQTMREIRAFYTNYFHYSFVRRTPAIFQCVFEFSQQLGTGESNQLRFNDLFLLLLVRTAFDRYATKPNRRL